MALLVERVVAKFFGTNCWIIAPSKGAECVVVDPGIGIPNLVSDIHERLNAFNLKPAAILITHGHLDHTFSVLPLTKSIPMRTFITGNDRFLLSDPLGALDSGGVSEQFLNAFGSENFYESSQSNVGYNFNASKSAACVIYVDRVQIFQGSLRLLEMIVDNGTVEYEVSVFGELGGLVQAIGNAKLEQLDFSAYDTQWTVANIKQSWEYATGVQVSGVTVTGYYPGSGLYFPLIDYGNLSVSKDDWDFRAMRPALYAKEIIDKIITNAGYTYDCDFFNSQLFRRLIIPNNQKSIRNFTSLGLKANADAATYTNVGNLS